MKMVFGVRYFQTLFNLICCSSSNETSSTVTVGFFDDIYIPTAYLPQPSALYVIQPLISTLLITYTSDPNERCHFWIPDSSLTSSTELLDTPVTERMYIERDEVVRVRVESDEFYDDEPGPPKLTEGVQVKREPKRAPYTICVSTIHIVIPFSTNMSFAFLSTYSVR